MALSTRGYEVIDESKLRRTRTWEAEKSPQKAVIRAHSCTDHGMIIAGRRNRRGVPLKTPGGMISAKSQ